MQTSDELQYGYVQKSELFSMLWTAFISLEWPEDPRWVSDKHSSAVLIIQISSRPFLKWICGWFVVLLFLQIWGCIRTVWPLEFKGTANKILPWFFPFVKGKRDRVVYDFSRTYDFREKSGSKLLIFIFHEKWLGILFMQPTWLCSVVSEWSYNSLYSSEKAYHSSV